MSTDAAPERTATRPPVPEYERERYFPTKLTYTPAERRHIRRKYGPVRAFYQFRAADFHDFQRRLNQAHVGADYDVYLTRATYRALVAAVLGVLFGVVVATRPAVLAVLTGVRAPITVPDVLGKAVLTNRVLLVTALLAVLFGGLFAVAVWGWAYVSPKLVVDRRRRNINLLLPHAIVYMFALSYGGLKPLAVLRETAVADDTYGEVAAELQRIVRDVDLFGTDLVTAVQNARNITPSENLEQFLDDMLSVLDSGSDFTSFIEGESRTYRKQAQEEQESFLQTLSILSEVYIVAFVAGPLFLIVTLVLISLLGGDSLPATYAVVYLLLPLGMVGFLLFIDYAARPFDAVTHDVTRQRSRPVPPEALANATAFREYRRRRTWLVVRRLVGDPLTTVRQQSPWLSVVLTLPIALLAAGAFAVATDATAGPLLRTAGYAVVPFLVVAGPLSALYELRRWRTDRIAKRFPETLNLLASANQMGIRLTDALVLVGRWSEGVLETELRRVGNDIAWNHDIERALVAMGERLGLPQVTRTMKLIATGSRSSSDLSKVLTIAAEDTRNRYKLEWTRHREVSAYVAILLIGFFVYLGVVVMLDTNYVTPIGELGERTSAMEGSANPFLSLGAVPTETYRTLLFHSALIQGVGSGLLAGKLADNAVLSGLKYSLVLVCVTLAAFLLL